MDSGADRIACRQRNSNQQRGRVSDVGYCDDNTNTMFGGSLQNGISQLALTKDEMEPNVDRQQHLH